MATTEADIEELRRELGRLKQANADKDAQVRNMLAEIASLEAEALRLRSELARLEGDGASLGLDS